MALEVIDASRHGFLARATAALPERMRGVVCVQLGAGRVATGRAMVVRSVGSEEGPYYGFRIEAPDRVWQQCIADLEARDAPPGAARHTLVPNEQREDWSVHDVVMV